MKAGDKKTKNAREKDMAKSARGKGRTAEADTGKKKKRK